MPAHKESRHLPYSPKQLFDLVADVEKYPEFLPWCVAARINKRMENILHADLVIGFKTFRESYTSHVTLLEPTSPDGLYEVRARLVHGPFSHLMNDWVFRPGKIGGTDIDFSVDFKFKSAMLEAIIGQFFDNAIHKMVTAFEERAKVLYS